VTDTEVVFVYNFLGIPPEQRVAAPKPAPGRHLVGVEFVKEGIGENNECLGTVTLHVDGDAIAKRPCRTQTGHYALAGEGLCIGYDSGDRVSAEYRGRNRFAGGEIIDVVYDIGADAHVDLELRHAAKLARD
jgi:arylsulfatase